MGRSNDNVIKLSDKKARDLVEKVSKPGKEIDVEKIIEKASFRPEDIKKMNPTERLNLMLEVCAGLVPIAEGMYLTKPYPNYAYAITNLMNQYQGLEDQLNNIINWEVISEEVFNLLKPVIERLILNFGKNLKREMVSLSKEVGNKQQVKESFNTIYTHLGKELQEGLLVLEENLRSHLLSK